MGVKYTLNRFDGDVDVFINESKVEKSIGMELPGGSAIKSYDKARVEIKCEDTKDDTELGYIRLNEKSEIDIDTDSNINVPLGSVWSRIKNWWHHITSCPDIKCPIVAAGVRGTEFIFNVAGDGTTEIDVIDGSMNVTHEVTGEEFVVNSGEKLVSTIEDAGEVEEYNGEYTWYKW